MHTLNSLQVITEKRKNLEQFYKLQVQIQWPEEGSEPTRYRTFFCNLQLPLDWTNIRKDNPWELIMGENELHERSVNEKAMPILWLAHLESPWGKTESGNRWWEGMFNNFISRKPRFVPSLWRLKRFSSTMRSNRVGRLCKWLIYIMLCRVKGLALRPLSRFLSLISGRWWVSQDASASRWWHRCSAPSTDFRTNYWPSPGYQIF